MNTFFVSIDWPYLKSTIIKTLMIVLAGLSLYLTSWQYLSVKTFVHKNNLQELEQLKNAYGRLIESKKILLDYYPRYLDLKNQGLLAQEQRLRWVESLDQAKKQLRLPGLYYEISEIKPYTPPFPFNNPNLSLYTSKMLLRIKGFHEEDFFRLHQALKKSAVGLFNTQHCKFQRYEFPFKNITNTPNINIECELFWFSFIPNTTVAIKP